MTKHKWHSEIDKERECWRIISEESQDHDGDGALTHVADVYDPKDTEEIIAAHNRLVKKKKEWTKDAEKRSVTFLNSRRNNQ